MTSAACLEDEERVPVHNTAEGIVHQRGLDVDSVAEIDATHVDDAVDRHIALPVASMPIDDDLDGRARELVPRVVDDVHVAGARIDHRKYRAARIP